VGTVTARVSDSNYSRVLWELLLPVFQTVTIAVCCGNCYCRCFRQ